jgi:hypothetical protein
MGATSWRYYTAYHPDLVTAFQRLRDEVFARGEYVDLTGSLEDALRNTMKRFGRDPEGADAQRDIAQYLQMQRHIESGDKEALRGLPREDRLFARRARQAMTFARLLGADPPGRRSGRPQSIDELLEQAAECGTHSILDITEVAARRTAGAAAPLPGRTIQKVFGNPRPTHDQVEAGWAEIAEMLGREQAYYLVVFRDGQPDEYAFIGCSGD